jgi:periplasmic protein TonB
MSATTVNAFPPLHAFDSSRSWFLALIVLLHAGFFWVLTHGVTIGSVSIAPPLIVIDPAPSKPQPPPKPHVIDDPVVSRVFVPEIDLPHFVPAEDTNAPRQTTDDPPPPTRELIHEAPGAGPIIVQPQGDPRFPFTEPEYPTPDIRMGHEGTVWLTIEILPNGRVGAVRVDQTSGFARLDESAVREARKWRMKPGTQDGIAIPMYKRVPVTFRLKD